LTQLDERLPGTIGELTIAIIALPKGIVEFNDYTLLDRHGLNFGPHRQSYLPPHGMWFRPYPTSIDQM
jgi:hypothetical protein